MASPAVLLQYERVHYPVAWALQRRLMDERLADRRPDTLLLLEHEPVFTLGKRAPADGQGDRAPWSQVGHPLYRVERGGSITYHGPGQIVGYPILKLSRFCPGPRQYVARLEEVLIRTLAEWGIPACRRVKLPGVWVGDEGALKIASLGVRLVRGVTMHGFALNATVDLEPFSRIVPCGIEGCRMTSMEERLDHTVDLQELRARIAHHFAAVFDLEWVRSNEIAEPVGGRAT